MKHTLTGYFLTGLMMAGSLSTHARKCQSGDPVPKDYKHRYSFYLDSGYTPLGHITPRTMADTVNDTSKILGWVFDHVDSYLKPDAYWTRAAYKYLIFPLLSQPIYKGLYRTHETYAQGRFLNALGLKPSYLNEQFEDYASGYGGLLGKNMMHSFKAVFFGSVPHVHVLSQPKQLFDSHQHSSRYFNTNPKVALAQHGDLIERGKVVSKEKLKNQAVESTKIKYDSDVADILTESQSFLSAQGQALFHGSVYNMIMDHAHYIEQDLWYENGGHVAQLIPHLSSKVLLSADWVGNWFMRNQEARDYTTLGRVSTAYQNMGIETSEGELALVNALTSLGSAQFWGMFLEKHDYLSVGDTYIRAPQYKGFKLPNFSQYLSSNGPTIHMSTGYRSDNDWWIPFNIEYVYKGPNKFLEITAGLRKKFAWKNAYLHGELIGNTQTRAFSFQLEGGMDILPVLLLKAGLTYNNIETLHGERHISSLENGISHWAFWCKVGTSL